MRYKWIGVIVAACLSVGMSVLAYGSVKDDLAALEKEAGIDADEGASISSRLSTLEKELDISADENSSTSDRIKALQKELGLESADETEAEELSEPEQAVLVAYQKIKEELLNPHSLEVYESEECSCPACKAPQPYS